MMEDKMNTSEEAGVSLPGSSIDDHGFERIVHIPEWVWNCMALFIQPVHPKCNIADAQHTHNRCDDIARLLYRIMAAYAPSEVNVEIADCHDYHGGGKFEAAHPSIVRTVQTSTFPIPLNHKVVVIDDLVVDLSGSQFGNWPGFYTVGSMLQVWGKVAFLRLSDAVCGECLGKGISIEETIASFCRERDSICKNCGGTGRFLIDVRYRLHHGDPWVVLMNTPRWREWIKKYATPEFYANGHLEEIKSWPTRQMVIRADGSVMYIPVETMKPKLGRNDPCFCGSGKKFKRCHGA